MSNIPRIVQEAAQSFEGMVHCINNEVGILKYAPLEVREGAAIQMEKLEDMLRSCARSLQEIRSFLIGFDEPIPVGNEDLEATVLQDIAKINNPKYRPTAPNPMPWVQDHQGERLDRSDFLR